MQRTPGICTVLVVIGNEHGVVGKIGMDIESGHGNGMEWE